MPDKVVSHIDANVILNYLNDDDLDLCGIVKQQIVFRKNWGNNIYKINVYAIGEIAKQLINPVKRTNNDLPSKINNIKKLVMNNHFELIRIDDISPDWVNHFKEINKLDKIIQYADKFNIALFCADVDAKIFYTFDKGIIKSEKVNKYIKRLDPAKRIKEME